MNSGASRERLYEVFTDVSPDVDEKIERALSIGREYFQLPIGFVTRIEDGTQRVLHATGEHEQIHPGATCPLEEAYCRRTVELDGSLAVHEVTESDISRQAIEHFQLGTYIGAKITVDDETFGTVCFADRGARGGSFSETEEMFIELMARLVGSALERRAYEQDLEARNEHLRAEKQRFERIAETSFDVLFRVDDAARFSYVSQAVERILGYRPSSLVGEPIYQYMTEASAETAQAAFGRILDGERVEKVELEFLDDESETVVIEVNASPITEDGSVAGMQGVGRDVTDQRERIAELEIKDRAMDEATIGISISDPNQYDGPLVYVNEGFERLTGYDAEDVIGRNCRLLQGPETDPGAVAELREAIQNERSTSVELLNYRADGTPFWNQIRVSPVFDESGTLRHFLGFQEDITERRRTEELIRLLNRVLRHNMRNDMTALIGLSELVEQDTTDEFDDIGGRIKRICTGLMDLSENARDLEKNARESRDPERLAPEAFLRETASTRRGAYPDATVDVHVETSRHICAGSELRQAVGELIENGLKHNDSDNRQVTVTAREDEEWIEIVVTDNGPGITEMEAAVVSDGRETALEHGSGLGLWLTNWIVTRYGGSFQLERSEKDEPDGTKATIRLPAIDDETPISEAERGPTVLFR